MPFVKVARMAEVPAESVIEVMVGGEPYAICHTGGAIRALGGRCIHRGGPLGEGQLHEGSVVCPYHMWEFDCVTGEYDYDATRRAPVFDVKVADGDIYLQVP